MRPSGLESRIRKVMPDDEVLADLIALALAGRPDRLQAVALAMQAPKIRASAAEVTETLSNLAWLEPPDLPSSDVKAQLFASLRKQPKRAVLVIDMINDHLEPQSLLEIPRARAIKDALLARLDAARARHEPVIYVVDRHEPEDSDLDEWGVHAVAGTHGAEIWAPLAPQEGDAIVPKPSYSSFFASGLEALLGTLEVDTLVLTGCSTEIQLLVTATEAMQQGFDVETPVELQAGTSEASERAALGALAMMKPYKPAREALLLRRRGPAPSGV